MRCLKCGSEAIVKNGRMKGLQRYKCKQCTYQFTQEAPSCREGLFTIEPMINVKAKTLQYRVRNRFARLILWAGIREFPGWVGC